MTSSDENRKFQIVRGAEAPSLVEKGCMAMPELTPVQLQGFAALHAPGQARGDEVHVLVDLPGFHLSHVWFKKDYPLPLHSHDCDCLYYVIAGSLRLGTEEVGPRDSFMIPANVPYAYTPGPDGVELLEFRHATSFDFNVRANSEAFWQRAAQVAADNNEAWRDAKKPALNT